MATIKSPHNIKQLLLSNVTPPSPSGLSPPHLSTLVGGAPPFFSSDLPTLFLPSGQGRPFLLFFVFEKSRDEDSGVVQSMHVRYFGVAGMQPSISGEEEAGQTAELETVKSPTYRT